MNESSVSDAIIDLSYEADLCGNIEQALKGLQGYGIMALEILQNADDAGAKYLSFNVGTDGLVIANDATFSSCGLTAKRCPWEISGDPKGLLRPCNFHAISRMGSRSKLHAPDNIGRFGIGFVAVYQITDTPVIRSIGIELVLNPLTGEAKQKRVPTGNGTEFELRWASVPSPIRSALNASPTPPDVTAKVIAEVTSAVRSSLLFLRNLERVEIRQDGQKELTVDITRAGKEVTLTFRPNEQIQRWLVLSRKADDAVNASKLVEKYEVLGKLKRSRTVSVAIASDGQLVDGMLFAYLPTQHSAGLPLHINGDFFPHASRQEIVLKGEGHERYWNEALIATAALIVGENILLLRDRLGPTGLWKLGLDASQQRSNGVFAQFWSRFSVAAKSSPTVWTSERNWSSPAGVHLPPGEMNSHEIDALASIGLKILHPSLRQYWQALSGVGVANLGLQALVARLRDLNGHGIQHFGPNLRNLWAAIARVITTGRSVLGFDVEIKKLKSTKFLIDIAGNLASPEDVWRMPPNLSPDLVRQYLPDCPIADSSVLEFPEIAALIDEYTLDDFAANIAESVTDEETADLIIGTAPKRARGLYSIFVQFQARPTNNTGKLLKTTPILRTPKSFVSPARAVLPGGFKDPTGYFEFVDTSLYPERMHEFSEKVLEVRVLNFSQYIGNYLQDIISSGLKRSQYEALIAEIVRHKNELDEEGDLDRLAQRAFVRTRAGAFVQPRECYFWSAKLEGLLGKAENLWVDETWLPINYLARLRDILETRLGMPSTVTAQHIVGRVEDICNSGSIDEVTRALTPIIRHLIESWPTFSEADRDELEELRSVEFLTAFIEGQLDTENLYRPAEVFRAIRASGFASQVPVIALTPLRQSSAAVNALLDFFEVPAEPETAVVVAHLQQCISTNSAANDLTYAILSERVEKKDGLAAIEKLRGAPFIFDSTTGQFLTADKIFWSQPPFKGHWWRAATSMSRFENLYSYLGVRDAPAPVDYAALMIEIAGRTDLDQTEIAVHSHCLRFLCEALESDTPELGDAIKQLRGDRSLISLDGNGLYPDQAVWIDNEQLAAAFGSGLNDRLVQNPDVARGVATIFFNRLGVRAISDVAQLCLASEPDRKLDEQATQRIRERSDLLLWLMPNRTSRAALKRLLVDLTIHLTTLLEVHAEIHEFNPPVRSPKSSIPAFYERDTGILHLEGISMRRGMWTAALKAIFSEIESIFPLADVKPLVATSLHVMLSDDRDEAEQILRSCDYRPLDESEDVELGESLEDTLTEDSDETQGHADESVPEENEGVSDTDQQHLSKSVSRSSADIGFSQPLTTDRPTFQITADSGTQMDGEAGQSETGDTYKSKPRTREDNSGDDRSGIDGSSAQKPKGGTPTDQDRRASLRPGKVRTSRMLTYVGTGKKEAEPEQSAKSENKPDISELIDQAAIKAALRYEQVRGWRAVEQPHDNPGYDIVSTAPDGRRRIIEVKGLEAEWTERGVKLSHIQFGMAQQYNEEYWIYVVEKARDLDQQKLSAICNPFKKAEEYWFDSNWRNVSEEKVNTIKLNIHKGTRIEHETWGVGKIVNVEESGLQTYVKVDFGFQGLKYVPFGSHLRILD